MTLPFPFTKHGCGDVRGAHAVWSVGGRHYLGEIVGLRRDQVTGGIFLQCVHMDGSPTPEVSAGAVRLLQRTYENAE